MKIETTFTIAKWDEQPCHELEGGCKISHASVVKQYDGGLKGEGTFDMLTVSRADGSAVFTGIEHIRGEMQGRKGSFVVKHEGTFGAGGVKGCWTTVAGAGTGDLQSLVASADFAHSHAERYDLVIDVES